VSVDDPVIITCAISGALAGRERCPAIPYTPAEYAAEARRIVDEGGVMIHIHARRQDGTPSHAVEDFRAITEAIRAEVGDEAIVNFSTGAVGVPVQERVASFVMRVLGGVPPTVHEARAMLGIARRSEVPA
jgi:3-keto-5-aminohexanoate cleavage enzyme